MKIGGCLERGSRSFSVEECYNVSMKAAFTAVIERDADTGMLVGYVPGFAGAHSQGATMDELRENLKEVIEMLLEDGPPDLEGEFVGTQLVTVD